MTKTLRDHIDDFTRPAARGDARIYRTLVALSEDEYDALQELAEAEGLPLATLVRGLALLTLRAAGDVSCE